MSDATFVGVLESGGARYLVARKFLLRESLWPYRLASDPETPESRQTENPNRDRDPSDLGDTAGLDHGGQRFSRGALHYSDDARSRGLAPGRDGGVCHCLFLPPFVVRCSRDSG